MNKVQNENSDENGRVAIHRKKKVREFPVPSRDVTTKLSLGGNNDVKTELFLPRGSLVSDIPAGEGKLVNLFLRCRLQQSGHRNSQVDMERRSIGREYQRWPWNSIRECMCERHPKGRGMEWPWIVAGWLQAAAKCHDRGMPHPN